MNAINNVSSTTVEWRLVYIKDEVCSISNAVYLNARKQLYCYGESGLCSRFENDV